MTITENLARAIHDEKEADKIKRRYRKYPIADLAQECSEADLYIEYWKKIKALALEEMNGRFPREKAEEEFVTEFGTFKRKLDRSFSVNVDTIAVLRRILGDAFGDYVEERVLFSVIANRIEELEAELGDSFDYYVHRDTGYALTAKGRSALKKDDALNARCDGLILVDASEKITFKRVDK